MPMQYNFNERWVSYSVPPQFAQLIGLDDLGSGTVNMVNVFKIVRVPATGGDYTILTTVGAPSSGLSQLHETELRDMPLFSLVFALEDVPHFLA